MIAITGITGRTGKVFLKKISDNCHLFKNTKIRTIVRSTSNINALKDCKLPLDVIEGNLRNLNFLKESFKNVKTVLHIAGIDKSLNVIKAAIEANVDWVILVHTTGIYSKYKSASSEYINIEKEIEQLTKTKKLKVTILRPTMIYGSMFDQNISIFIKMVDRLKIFPVVSKGEFLLQPVHFEDLADAYFKVLVNERITKGKNYILSGKSPILLIDILREIEVLLSKKNYYISVPFALAYIFSILIFYVTFKKVDYREKVQRLVENRSYPSAEAITDFGYSPREFSVGIKSEVCEYKRFFRKESG